MGKIVVKSVRIDKEVNDKMAEISQTFGVSQNDLLNTILKLYLKIPTLESKVVDRNPVIKIGVNYPTGVEIKEPQRVGVIGGLSKTTTIAAIEKAVDMKSEVVKNDGVNEGVSEGVSEGINVFGNTVVTIQEAEEDED